MDQRTQHALIQAITDHPIILKAAITGSHARRTADQFSDLDMLLVASEDLDASGVRTLLSGVVAPLMCAFHLTHYCTVLTNDFQKIDLAISNVNDSPSQWVVHDYQIIKGDPGFEAQLSAAANATRQQRAAHLNPDVSLDNVVLLLLTASDRVRRGELVSAQAFLAMACDMVIAMELRGHGINDAADFLDPRRRLERLNPPLATTIQQCLFTPPGSGVFHLARFTLTSGAELTASQIRTLDYLLGSQ